MISPENTQKMGVQYDEDPMVISKATNGKIWYKPGKLPIFWIMEHQATFQNKRASKKLAGGAP